jgi:hypothetical protein
MAIEGCPLVAGNSEYRKGLRVNPDQQLTPSEAQEFFILFGRKPLNSHDPNEHNQANPTNLARSCLGGFGRGAGFATGRGLASASSGATISVPSN